MRIAKIVRRSNMQVAPQFGIEGGKIFNDSVFLDGTRRESIQSAPLYLASQGTLYPYVRELIGMKTSPSLSPYRLSVTYSSLNGMDNTEFVSRMGITAGNRYRCYNGQLVDQDNNVLFVSNASPNLDSSVNYWGNKINQRAGAGVVQTSLQIVHETENHFVVYGSANESSASCALLVIQKNLPTLAYSIFSGQFSIHRLGVTRPTETTPEHTLFLVMLNSRTGYCSFPYTTDDNNPISAANGSEDGARVLLFGFRNSAPATLNGSYYYVRLLHKMGAGPYNTSYNRYSFCSQRFLVDADSSMAVKDDDGYLTAFSFVAQNPAVVSESSLFYTSATARNIKLNDNLCLFRIECMPDAQFTQSYSRINLPADFLSAEWTQYGQQSNNREHMSLISGKAFYAETDAGGFLCIMMDCIGYNDYMNTNVQSSAEYYRYRNQPDLQPALIKIPVDLDKKVITDAQPIVHRFPVRFGANINEISMLLRKNNQEIVLPSVTYYPGNSNNKGVDISNAIALIDVVQGTHSVVDLSADENKELGLGQLILAVGATDDKLFVIDSSNNYIVLDDGPTVQLSLEHGVVEGPMSLTVTVSSPSNVSLVAFNGTFDNGKSSITLEIFDSMVVPVVARPNLQVHAVECTAIEVEV